MKTIQFTGTETEIENLHSALDISDNDMPQQSETRVYVLDTLNISIYKGFEELSEEEWIAESERQGGVYSLQSFERAFNEEEVHTDFDVVKIINVIKN